MPTVSGPPSTKNSSAGAEPRASTAVSENTGFNAWNTSSAVTIVVRSQTPPASSGICSMNLNLNPSSSAHLSSATASPSFTPGINTVLILIGVKSASRAAFSPLRTSSNRSRNVIALNRSALKVSSETFTRSKPASLSGWASAAKRMPFVVNESFGGFGRLLILATISTMSGRSSGSPPVNRTSSIPASIPTSRMVINSSVESKSSVGIQAAKSCGMQYVQRRLQRSVNETRMSRCTRPKVSISALMRNSPIHLYHQ